MPRAVARDATKAQHPLEQRDGRREHALLDPHRVDAADLVRGRHRARVPDRELAILFDLDEREREAVRIAEGQHALSEALLLLHAEDVVLAESLPPPLEAPRRDRQRDLPDHARPGTGGGHAGPREERHVGSGRARRVRVEEVIGAGVVLVDASLDEPHPQDTRVERQVLLRMAGDRRDVVDAADRFHLMHSFGPLAANAE